MKHFILAASAALLATACATPDVVVPVAGVGTPTGTYMQMAASGDMFEIQSGQLALQRSCDPAVRSFAQMIIDDHTRLSSQMMQVAQASNLPMPPTQLAPHHQQMLQTLTAATTPGFEGTFRAQQMAAHQEALNLHQTYASSGDVAPLRAVAAQAVPAIQTHLGHVQSLPSAAPCALPQTQVPVVQPAPRRAGERG
jgi:putative membrane protein